MNTFTMIKAMKSNIVNLFKPSNENRPQHPQEITPAANDNPATVYGPAESGYQSESKLLSPQTVNLVYHLSKELENDGNSLSARALQACAACNGQPDSFINEMDIAVMTYKSEADKARQEVEVSLSRDINALLIRNIELQNKINHINQTLIPEQSFLQQEYQRQLTALLNSREQDVSLTLTSERITIVELAIARIKELLRKMKYDTLELKKEIESNNFKIAGLKEQFGKLNFFNESILKRRLSIFYSGWLISLDGIGADENLKQKTRELYDQYFDNIKTNWLLTITNN